MALCDLVRLTRLLGRLACAAIGLICTNLLAVSAQAQTAPATQAAAQTNSQTSAIWLLRGQISVSEPAATPQLSREILRQAVLIATRDGVGLQTRDASLNEWDTPPPADRTLQLNALAPDVTLEMGSGDAPRVLWNHRFENPPDLFRNVPELVAQIEPLSRRELVDALRGLAPTGQADAIMPNAPAPPDSEKLLSELEEASQLVAARHAHAAIRLDGESEARLGVLVRAYANLGQLTRYHWSSESSVYVARSLLYAQRMVAQQPSSAVAFWHRAYALALAGYQGPALIDLGNANLYAAGMQPPPWVDLLEPFCKYRTGDLTQFAAAHPQLAPLAMFMAVLTVECNGVIGATISLSQAAQQLNPDCMRLQVLQETLSTGPVLDQQSQAGEEMFGRVLRDKMAKLSDLPEAAVDLLRKQRADADPLAAAPDFWRALIRHGDVSTDSGEPSWAALGRMVQETTFALAERRAYSIYFNGKQPLAAFAQCRALTADHPYELVIRAYSRMRDADRTIIHANLGSLKLSEVEPRVGTPLALLINRIEPLQGRRITSELYANADPTAWDLETELVLYAAASPRQPLPAAALAWLRRCSPKSPMFVVGLIRDHWSVAQKQLPDFDQSVLTFPAIEYALSAKYAQMARFADCEKSLRQVIAVSPDLSAYLALATLYHRQNQREKYLDTLREFLSQGVDTGVDRVEVQKLLAEDFLLRGDYEQALSYADAAGASHTEVGLNCDAKMREIAGDWQTAERLIKENIQKFGVSPSIWVAMCVRTGHGDLEAAEKLGEQQIDIAGKSPDDDQMATVIVLRLMEGRDKEAMDMMQQEMDSRPVLTIALHLAVLADEFNYSQASHDVLEQAITMNPQPPALARFAQVLHDAVAAGPDGEIDDARLTEALRGADDKSFEAITYMAALYEDNHHHPLEAEHYLESCLTHGHIDTLDYTLATILGKKYHLDGGALALQARRRAASQPTGQSTSRPTTQGTVPWPPQTTPPRSPASSQS